MERDDCSWKGTYLLGRNSVSLCVGVFGESDLHWEVVSACLGQRGVEVFLVS